MSQKSPAQEAAAEAEPQAPDQQDELAQLPADEVTIGWAIEALAELSPQERYAKLQGIYAAIDALPDVQIRGQLIDRLGVTLAQLAQTDPEAPSMMEDEAMSRAEAELARQEFARLEAARQEWDVPVPSEDELRAAIDELTVDPDHREIGLTEAMRLGGLIDRIEDPQMQARLRRRLEDRLVAIHPKEQW